MYIAIGCFIFLCIVFVCIQIYRRPRIIKKVCGLCMEEKCRILSALIEPFGFCYDLEQDIFISRQDAWQRSFGYCAFFDWAAPFFQMVFDCLPVYFEYDGRTWLIEFWKGQYGINTGCETGIYKADGILSPAEQKHALVHAVSDAEMLPICTTLYRDSCPLFSLSERHWWLAGFSMGLFSRPHTLRMSVSIAFPNGRMLCAFVSALRECGFDPEHLCIEGLTATLCFHSRSGHGFFMRLICAFSQWKNRIFCGLYLWITRPFCKSIDRLLYLYYFLPFAFRKMITIRKPRRRRRHSHEH